MITLKSRQELVHMRAAGKIVAEALNLLAESAKPGVSTGQLNALAHQHILRRGATPSFLGYNGFPGSICVSLNSQVIHGIPSMQVLLQKGDIVSFDVGACIKGYHADAALTVGVGQISPDAARLIAATRQSFYEGIAFAKVGYRVSDISAAIGAYAEAQGYSVVRDYTGHGVGTQLHEDPSVLNFGKPGRGARLAPGMTLAIEPMVNAGGYAIRMEPDEWTVVTADGSLSAHYEHTIVITGSGDCEILTVE